MARAKSKANYFTKETEDYIKLYNVSVDTEYRAKIFTDHIYLPFYKLAENIIHTFKFYYTDVNHIEDGRDKQSNKQMQYFGKPC